MNLCSFNGVKMYVLSREIMDQCGIAKEYKIKAMRGEMKITKTPGPPQRQRKGRHRLFTKQHGAGLKYQGLKKVDKEVSAKKSKPKELKYIFYE